MKKTFLLLAAMCCMLMNVQASTLVGYLGDQAIYDDKGQNPYPGVTYDHSTATLTFNNASVSTTSNGLSLSDNFTSTFTIVVKGENTLQVTANNGVYSPRPLVIKAGSNGAELTISASKYAFSCTKPTTFGGGSYSLKLNLNSNTAGIYHTNAVTFKNNATVKIEATSINAISGEGAVTLENGVYITQPYGAYISDGRMWLQGSPVTSEVTIKPHNLVEYNLWIEGTRVNDLSQSDILRDGKVSYNPTTKTLTLNNAFLYSTSSSAIKSSIVDLKINVLGTCTLTCTSSTLAAIETTANTTLTTSGSNAKVTIENSYNTAIINDGSDFNIDGGSYGMTVNIFGKSGIQGKNSSADLSIKNATVGFSSTTYGAVYGQSSINLNDCAITSPTGAKIYNGAIVDSKNQVVTSVVNIRKIEKYALYIAGTQVTELNCSDILGDGGRVKYSHTQKTLTLNDATISSSSAAPISNSISWLQIICNGTNTLSYTGSSTYQGALSLSASTSVITTQSNSQLTLNSTASGIYLGDNNSEINGNIFRLKVDVKGSKYGIYGTISEGGGSQLTIREVNMDIAATTSGAISNLLSLTLTDVTVNEPTGSTFSTTNHALVKSGSVVKTAVKIGKPIEKYGVLIKGEQVTSENCNDILGDGGKVKYDNATKTLTLNNASISYAGDVISLYDDINILCKGTNTVSCTADYQALYGDDGGATFTGTGSITLSSSDATAIVSYKPITIKDGCTVTVQSGKSSAISLGSKTLTVDGSTLIAKGNGKNATIAGCNSLVMNNGVAIRSNHTYDATLHKFYVKGTSTEAKDDIKIGLTTPEPTTTSTITYKAKNKLDLQSSDFTPSYYSHEFEDGKGIITFFSNVQKIGNGAFEDQQDLLSIKLPASITTIGYEAFDECENLQYIICLATTPPTCGNDCFNEVNKDIPVYVPEGSISDYQSAEQWEDFTNFRKYVEYPLEVNGDVVSSVNQNDILGNGGKMKYNDATKTLSLNNVNLTGSNANLIYSSQDLTIQCSGTNTLKNTSSLAYQGIMAETGTLTISGEGKLNISSDNGHAILANNKLLLKEGVVVTAASGNNSAVRISSNALEINDASLCAKGNNTTATITGCNQLTLTNASFLSSHSYDSSSHKFLTGGQEAKDEIRIGTEYDLYVKDKQVTSFNCNDILDNGGNMKYYPNDKKLEMRGVSLSGNCQHMIWAKENITIFCVYSNSIQNTGTGDGIHADKTLSLTGSGTMTISSGNDHAICINNNTLSINKITVYVKGNNSVATITGCNKLNLSYTTILSAHTYDTSTHQFLAGGKEAKDEIIFGESIQVKVADVQVTYQNKDNVLGDGSVSYDYVTKTLSLTNANIDGNYDYSVWADQVLTIECNGQNTIHNSKSGKDGILVENNHLLDIKGSGSLSVSSDSHHAISTYYLDVASTLTAKGNKTMATISQCEVFYTTDTKILSNHTYDDVNYRFVDKNGQEAKDDIIIGKPYDLTIAGRPVSFVNCKDVLGDGKVAFDADQSKLTLTNATIDGTDADATIYIAQDLTIVCEGDNHISNSTNNGIYADYSKLTLSGSGALTVNTISSSAIACDEDLTISDGCTVTASSQEFYAINLFDYNLTVDNAGLIAKGNGSSATIAGCYELTMNNGVAIRSYHTFDSENSIFVIKGTSEEAMDDIIIGTGTTGIEEVAGDRLQVTGSSKVLRNGQLLILRDGKVYNALGNEMK